jgi:hypothetical protein
MSNLDFRAIGLFISSFGCVLSLCINFFLIPKTKKLEKIAGEIQSLREAMLTEIKNISDHNHSFREEMHQTYVSKENVNMVVENIANQVVKDYCNNVHQHLRRSNSE